MKSRLSIMVGLLVALTSCQPEPDGQRLYDDLVVSTNFDEAADFSTYSTFALPTDTIGFYSNNSDDTLLTAGESSFPRPVLSAVRRNLEAMGFEEVERNESPDVGINVFVVNNFNVFQQLVYVDPYYYPGSFYSGYYGFGSPYAYYPYVDTYAYNTGVLVLEMVDLKNRNASNQVKVIWNAYMGDVYSTLDLLPQTERAIDQAFDQSPYLKAQ